MASRTIKRNQTLNALDGLRENATLEPPDGHLKRERPRTQLGEPIRLEINRGAMAIDPNQAAKSDPLSATYVEQPYHHHFGFTFLGIEYWGFNFAGSIKEATRGPDRPRPSLSVRVARDGQPSKATTPIGIGAPKGGLRVRLGQT